mmetsp:Transcript_31388/g.79325  ORF Transcript_31388/g.79325 Transcript_31388/m.79325 type:complete len:267 (+) Transcript_31388:69-869(+)|eukprot:CAMPEP_0115441834 /NCGR_PEP_ID=MMETSP0271-20121206/37036_1 /TAXON_ID=71861 /ORGANISM="Scrippsiella trochoidea, Strain CCMP3099" /LENGTH=266 /DNA_ID=CAMNT_0002867649 /DNA_START=61 /DNA_END=861 /DNA_ORIENTATION=-
MAEGEQAPLSTPSKRRRCRAAGVRDSLWRKTRWSALAVAEDAALGSDGGLCQAEVVAMIDEKVTEMQQKVMMSCATALKSVVQEEGLLKAEDVRMLVEKVRCLEDARQSSQEETSRVLREALRHADLLTKSDLQAWQSELEALKAKIAVCEDNKTNVGEGLRKRLTKLQEKHVELMDRLEILEEEVFQTDAEGGLGDEADDADGDVMLQFPAAMERGWPVHLHGLSGRPELNGKAGWLGKWVEEKQRWEVRVGQEDLLIQEDNIIP